MDSIYRFAWEPSFSKFVIALNLFDSMTNDVKKIMKWCFYALVLKEHPEFSIEKPSGMIAIPIDILFERNDACRIIRYLVKCPKNLDMDHQVSNLLWVCYFATGSKKYLNAILELPDPHGIIRDAYEENVIKIGSIPIKE